jgi:hypothetical protein
MHVLHSDFFFENRTVHEIMLENIVERDRPYIAVWCMRIACWIPKATNINTQVCNTHCFSTATMVARTRLNVTFYVHYLYFYLTKYEVQCNF